MISISRSFIFIAMFVLIITGTIYGENTQPIRDYAADVEFNDNTRVTLQRFSFKDGPLTTKIGDSQITIQYESVKSINVQMIKKKKPMEDPIILSLIPNNNESPLAIRRPADDEIVGSVINDKLLYEFSAPLVNIKRIVIVPGSSVRTLNNITDNISCEVMLKNGDRMTLNEVNLYSIQYKDTGFVRGMLGIGTQVQEQEYEITTPNIKMKNGTATVRLSQIDTIDLKKLVVVLSNGETILPVKIKKPESVSDVIGFSVLEGMAGDRRVAIELSEIQSVSTKSVTAAKNKTRLEPQYAKPITRIKVTDKKGKSLEIKQGTIVSLYDAVSVSRILMSRTDVSWQIKGEGNFQHLEPAEECRQTLGIKYGGYWRLIDISDIRQFIRKGKKDTLTLKTGDTITGAILDLGVIEGKGSWGNVKYDPSDISSLEIIEH